MIVYQKNKKDFLEDVDSRDIEEIVRQAMLARTGRSVAPSEVTSWKESLAAAAKALHDADIPQDSGIAIEFVIHNMSKRIDLMISGMGEDESKNIVIVELKQWSEAKPTEKNGIVQVRFGKGAQEVPHPSYQAWSYASLLENFNEAVFQGGIRLHPCAYLHNYGIGGELASNRYREQILLAPLFLKGEEERQKLRSFIKRLVRRGDNSSLIFELDGARIRPSKSLVDAIQGMLAGNPEFVLVDDQKVAFETALRMAGSTDKHGKQVLIVEGGPGTGKSVLAINLLVSLTKMGLVTQYVSKNAAPRAVFESRLVGSRSKTAISNLFSGSGAFTQAPVDRFDALIVDEAHRLNAKSGIMSNLGENQVKEIIRSSKLAIFFLDENQTVTLKDIGKKAEIKKWAGSLNATVVETELISQFRCNGSEGYLAWLDDVLGIRETANNKLDASEFDFRVVDSPVTLRNLIATKNAERNRARLVAGYCWDWKSKKSPNAFDIELPNFDFSMQWNLTRDGSLWITAPESVDQVGCIHTCQGLELDYVGVIVGRDLQVRNGAVETHPEERSKHDQSIKGYKVLARKDAALAKSRTDEIIKNTYRTLMTRGMKGCFVYFVDEEAAAYFRSRLVAADLRSQHAEPQDVSSKDIDRGQSNAMPLKLVSKDSIRPFENAVPLIDLRFAAGAFSEKQAFDQDAVEWVSLPEPFKPGPGYFVAQVVGESMNRRILNGAWCLFRLNPMGTRQGRVVVAQHRDIADPDLGGAYTVKIYSSVKHPTDDDPVGHVSVRLSPDSDQPRYQPIEFTADMAQNLTIVAELIAVL